MTLAQRLRYVALLSYATAVGWASYEQFKQEGLEWESRNNGAMFATVMLVVAAVASLIEVAIKEKHNERESSNRT